VLTVVSLLAIFNIGSRRDQPPARAAAGITTAAGIGVTTPAPVSTVTPTATRPASATATAPRTSATPSKPVTSPPTQTLASPALPPGPPYTFQGTGSFSTVAGHSAVLGKGQLFRFTIDVENGITGVDRRVFADTVMAALSDQRSWIGGGAVALQRVESGQPVDFRISLSAPTTVRRVCGYSLRIETSCYAGSEGRVVLNVSRWTRGAVVFDGDLVNYRRYAVNHEIGHALGHNHAHYCLRNGMAPVMMQQSIGTRTVSRVCRPNPWPFPPGVSDAPGAEQVGDQPDAEFFRRNSS
jgi:hypothetical protein